MTARMLVSCGIFLLALTGCLRNHNESDATPATPAELNVKRRDYCERTRPVYEAQHFVNGQCDSAGFTSLFALACSDVYPVDLAVFSDETGRMHRAPDHKACWDYDQSDGANGAVGRRAGFSKDHMLMRMVGAWVQKDKAWVDQYFDYVTAHNGEICHASSDVDYVSRCLASPGLVALLYAMKTKLAGGSLTLDESADALPADFEAHLRVWGVWLKGKVYGGITDGEKRDLEDLATREPHNALYQAVAARYRDGNVQGVYELLADEAHWPVGKLPSKHENHCADYLFQRDELRDGAPNADWLPCTEEPDAEHPGTEFGAALYVASGQ